jgi:putative flippase GtrA
MRRALPPSMSDPPGPELAARNTSKEGIASRLTGHHAALLFGRNTVASFFIFGLDVGLLWLLVEQAGMSHLPAAAGSFLVAMSLQYLLSRVWVFKESERGLAKGYLYFLINAGIGLVVTLAAFAFLLELAGLHYLVARIIASVVAGLLVFALNATLNFREL